MQYTAEDVQGIPLCIYTLTTKGSHVEPTAVAIEAAHQAGELIRRQFHRPQQISLKGVTDIVTQVDRDAEDLIVRVIHDAFPQHGVWGEEGTATRHDDKYLWVIDPLDGTKNYAKGIPFFCVSIALAVDGQPVLGIIYDPIHDETFSAERGKGTRLNGMRVRFVPRTSLEQASVYFGLNPYRRPGNPGLALPMLLRLYPMLDMVRDSGSAALSLAYVACGRLDIAYHDRLNAWDMLAGVLQIQESGGVATEFSGRPISLASRDVIAANAPPLHGQVLRVAQEVMAQPWW